MSALIDEGAAVDAMELGTDPTRNKKTINTKESALDKHTDPFAQREGKTLVWKNVNMILVRF